MTEYQQPFRHNTIDVFRFLEPLSIKWTKQCAKNQLIADSRKVKTNGLK